ncbi:integrase/recombinase XerD [Neobacillus sp. B4I6]|uniref:tyrosine-type recombinase/integrase n=1 Tax=Neobacillus sp. B4I6 TaxID=3373925 RepID=UPI003D1A2CED
MQIKDLLEEYELEVSVRNLSESYQKNMVINVNLFIRLVGDLPVKEIGKAHLKKFIIHEQKRGIKAVSINLRLKHLKSMFLYAIEEGYMEKNPVDSISLLKQEKPLIMAYSESHINKLLDSIKGKGFMPIRNKTIITLLVETGLRNSELCSIKLSDISTNSIKILGKGSKWRVVPITQELQLQLIRYMRVRERYLNVNKQESPFLFISQTREKCSRSCILQMIKKVCKDLGIDVPNTIHNFRRSYIQQMVNNTDLYTVSRLVGHSNISTTQRYLESISNDKLIENGMNSPLSKIRK